MKSSDAVSSPSTWRHGGGAFSPPPLPPHSNSVSPKSVAMLLLCPPSPYATLSTVLPLSLLPTDAVHPLPPSPLLLFSPSFPPFILSISLSLCLVSPTDARWGRTYAAGQSGQTLFVYTTCVHTTPCRRRVVGRGRICVAFSRLSVIFPSILQL